LNNYFLPNLMDMKYCSNCGSEHLKELIPAGDNRPRLVCMSCQTIFYSNPKIVVGCLALYEGKILLCRRGIEPRYGKWNLPAGFMENGETVEEGALRELVEETGAKGRLVGLQSVFNVLRAQQVYLTFLVDLLEINFIDCTETLESKLFHPSEIPWEELAFHSNRFALEHYLANPQNREVGIGTLP
jgi:ADP-ribose pyrophosphatase YjhB (NUDIX family)